MAKRTESRLSFSSIRIEGSLLLPDVLAKVAAGEAPEQASSNYDILPGLKLRDEVLRYWTVGRALWTRFEAGRTGPNAGAVKVTFARDLLTRVLDFNFDDDSKARGGFQTLFAKNGSVPIVISGETNVDEIRSIPATSGKPVRKTPSAWLQNLLNVNSAALWGMATDGMRLRLLRDNDSLTRPALIEIDLDKIFRENLHDEFTVFWLLCHHTRFGKGDGNPDDCTLERWRGLGNTEGVTARDRLRDGVELALYHLGTGFLEHPANSGLRARLLAKAPTPAPKVEVREDDENTPKEPPTPRLAVQDFHKQLLRMVYRLIFLMTAEDRDVLLDPSATDAAEALFRTGYSTDKLRERSRQRAAWDRHADAYQGIRVLNRAARAGEPRLGIPALGGIFAEDQCPDIDDLPILNQRFLQALYHLSWMQHAKSLVRINWRDMETEELGSVYESLLELTPAITENAAKFYFVGGEGDDAEERLGTVKGNSRKTTGSYYTPDSLVQLLLDRTLDPVIDQVIAANPGNPDALLELDIIDPACGSGHFLLGAARRVANKLAELRTEGSATEVDYRQAMRDVIGHCIYGADRNPFAIELCRLALWLESIEPGRPLGFLDSRLVCGDSLVGVFKPEMLKHGIPDEAFAQLTGDDKETATAFRKWNKELRKGGGMFREYAIPEDIVAAADELIAMPSDSLKDIAAQAAAYVDLMGKEEWVLFKRACDAYVSAYFVPKKPVAAGALEAGHSALAAANIISRSGIPTSETVYSTLRDGSAQPPFINAAEQIQALHWFLTFPSVMQKGGFDVVVGNPPWERIKLQEQEFFASRAPEIANAANKAARERMIAELGNAREDSADRLTFEEFEAAKRNAEAASLFVRSPAEVGGRYALTGQGDVNTYALFAELFKDLANRSGRAGMVVPTGIATDATTAPFFAHLVEDRRLASLVDFENSRAIFPSVHRSYKFSILSLGHDEQEAEFSFFLTDPSQLSDSRRRFKLSPAQIAQINPNTKTAPMLRSAADAELVASLYSANQTLSQRTSGTEFYRCIDVNKDVVHLSRYVGEANGETLPLYEGKMLSFFNHRAGGYEHRGDSRGHRVLPESSTIDLQNPSFEPTPYWRVSAKVVRDRLPKTWNHNWLIAYKDVSAATNERSLIGCVMPLYGTDYSIRLCFPEGSPKQKALFLGMLNSVVFDYVLRQKMNGLHVSDYIIKQLPTVDLADDSSSGWAADAILELSYTTHSMEAFARDLGYIGHPFAWDEDRRSLLRAELDAYFARKYGLTRTELRYVLDPADVMGADYPSETFRGLKNKEFQRHQEYRTARLVLEAWDRAERGLAPLSRLPSSSALEQA